MACRDKCHKFKASSPSPYIRFSGPNSTGRYILGQKRCQVCEIFINYDGNHCPCCGTMLRRAPKASRVREGTRRLWRLLLWRFTIARLIRSFSTVLILSTHFRISGTLSICILPKSFSWMPRVAAACDGDIDDSNFKVFQDLYDHFVPNCREFISRDRGIIYPFSSY